MSNITRTLSSVSLVCVIVPAMLPGVAAATNSIFNYPHSSPTTTIELVNTPTAGFELPKLGNTQSVPASKKFGIRTDSQYRALFRPGSSTSIHSIDPELAAAHAVDLPAGEENSNSTWVTDNKLSKQARDLITYISKMNQHGLNPAQYSNHEWQSLVDAEIADEDIDGTSKSLRKAFHKVANAIGSGITDPTVSQKEWDREADSINADTLLDQIHRGLMNIDTALNSIEPQDPRYLGLKAMLQSLEELNHSEQVFVDANDKLKPGSEDESVLQLKNALIATGDLREQAPNSSVYDNKLEMAVKSFQLRHGLETNGTIDKKTLQHLNTPVEDRIAQVRANLERWRWFPSQLEESHIMVNIPEYRVRMMHTGTQLFEMDVVVGKPKHMTPVFSETMKQVVFAPTWTVPGSITNDELLPIERRSPGYLQKEEIDFFAHTSSGLKRVPRSSVTAETLNQRPFPYVLRQRAGKKNVLGKVKFMFPNKHAVYMHDTQAKKLFGKPQRAFSHGCIRLSNPDLMAYVIMQLDGYQQNEVNDYMALTDTTNVNLDTHIPVHIAYFTAWQDENGLMHFRDDIYKQDQRLIQALAAKQGEIDHLAVAQ